MLGQVPPPDNEVEQVTEVEVSYSHALQGGLVFRFLVAATFLGTHCGAITLAAASGIRPESIAPVKKKRSRLLSLVASFYCPHSDCPTPSQECVLVAATPTSFTSSSRLSDAA